MKKFLTLILAVCAVGLSSCNIKDVIKELTSLDGTTWEGSFQPNSAKPSYVVKVTYTFSETTYNSVAVEPDGKTTQSSGGYTFLAPVVTMDIEGSSSYTFRAVVNGDKLTMDPDGEFTVVLTKK